MALNLPGPFPRRPLPGPLMMNSGCSSSSPKPLRPTAAAAAVGGRPLPGPLMMNSGSASSPKPLRPTAAAAVGGRPLPRPLMMNSGSASSSKPLQPIAAAAAVGGRPPPGPLMMNSGSVSSPKPLRPTAAAAVGARPLPGPLVLNSGSSSSTTVAAGDGKATIPRRLMLLNAGCRCPFPKVAGDGGRFAAKAQDGDFDFTGTDPYVPIYVMLPLGTINMDCELVDREDLTKKLKALKSINVDGVMIDCWWGIAESRAPQQYTWTGYRHLFQIVRDLGLKLQVVMSFHQCGGNVGDDVHIPLPEWITAIGSTNPDIFFTDREGTRNQECLTWGIDNERVLGGRTAIEVYQNFMEGFYEEFREFFDDGSISEIEVGLGPCGELRYPSYPERNGWRYPGIGEFQCFDKYLLESLKKEADARGHSFWAKVPENTGRYNSVPHETEFFREGGSYDSPYGRFFLKWYSSILVSHGDRVLKVANEAFHGFPIAAKVSGVHWWYKTISHPTELMAGFYNCGHRDGYVPIVSMLKEHGAALNFTCVELRTSDQHREYPEALADPEGLVWQVLNDAWEHGILVACENALPCYGWDGYSKILENAKPSNDPDGRHLSAFTYLRLSPELMEEHNFMEFERFVKRMHGESA